jgi:hypothetical protein
MWTEIARSVEIPTRGFGLRPRSRVGIRPLVRAVPRSLLVVGAFVLAAAAFAGYYAARATSWAVMTDELQVARLATSIAERLSPVPNIHGQYYGALSQLYPLLIAPFFGLLDAPRAIASAHVLNALLLPSAAWPAFMLARAVSGSRAAGYAAAALTVFTPWLVLTSTLLTANAAYPAFVWAVFLCHRALAVPSMRRDALALVGLLLAFFARTQLFVLALALPFAIVVHEVGFAIARPAGPFCTQRVRTALKRALASHPVLAVAYGLGGAAAAGLASNGSLGAVVGNYTVTFGGDLVPGGIWRAAAAHLDQVVIGCGVLPFLLAVAWAGRTIVRPERREAHAYAVLLVLLVPLLTFEVASFDLRFTPHAFLQDRYLFYLAPLFAVGGAAALQEATSRLQLGLLAAAAGLFAWLLHYAVYDDERIIFWASPAAAFHPALVDAAAWVNLSAETLLAVAGAALLGGVIVLMRVRLRAALFATTAVVAAFGVFQAAYVFERFAEPALTRPAQLSGLARNWIDKAVPVSSSVALVPSPHDMPEIWWEAELWNTSVDRLLRAEGGPTFSPFPANDVTVNFAKGVLRGPEPSDFLLVSANETRFHLVEAARVVDGKFLRLVQVQSPHRLDWATRGVSADGWTGVRRPAILRIYGHGAARRQVVVLVLSASSRAALPLDFTLRGGGSERRGWVDPGGARAPVQLSVCVPADGFVDVTLRSQAAVRIPDGRLVGLHVDRLAVRPAGGCVPSQVSSR